MSRRPMLHAVLATAGLLAFAVAGTAGAQQAFSIDVGTLQANNCFNQAVCNLANAKLSIIAQPPGRVFQKKVHAGGQSGFGVSGGPSGAEIDIGETLVVELKDATTIAQSRSIDAIQILFLFNGPEHADRAEKVQVTVDGGAVYTLSTSSTEDNKAVWNGPGKAGWTGPGKVDNCGPTTLAGSGCFTITDPFPGAVSRVDFTAIHGGTPAGGAGTNDSDYSIGFIHVAADVLVNLGNCANPDPTLGCPVASVGGQVAASWNSMAVTAGPGDSLDTIMKQVELPDCRYIPQACLDLLQVSVASSLSDSAKREILINLGVIKPLDPSGPYRLHPAAQQLIVNKLLPPGVLELFEPDELQPLHIDSLWMGHDYELNGHIIKGLFFKAESGLVFSNTFGGLIDVGVLTGNELGCEPDIDSLQTLLLWDVITSLSEVAKSTGNKYMDMMINVGCQNPTKVSGVRLSLQAVNLAVTTATFGPTIKSFKPKVTENNDAVFARLVERLWKYEGDILANYGCKQADPVPSGGVAPLSRTVCNKLKPLWAVADLKIKLCVHATFYPKTAFRDWICGQAAEAVNKFEAAVPATATGPDVRNRVSEIRQRVGVFEHVWATRFWESVKITPTGFCREWGTCPASP